MHDVPRLQGDVLSGKQLPWFDAFPDTVTEDNDLGRVCGADIIGSHQCLGEGQAICPGDNMGPNLAVDRNARSLTLRLHLLHSYHGFLLAADVSRA